MHAIRLPFSSTPLFHPFKNRENRENAPGTGFRGKLKSVFPFTFHAQNEKGQRLYGLHTKDNKLGKAFRAFRLALVCVAAVTAVGTAIASAVTPAAPAGLAIAASVAGYITSAAINGSSLTAIKDNILLHSFNSGFRRSYLEAEEAAKNGRNAF